MARLTSGLPEFAPTAAALPPVEVPAMTNYFLDVDDDIAAASPALKGTKAWGLEVKKNAEGFNIRRGTVNELITAGANLFEVEQLADKLADYAGKYEQHHSSLSAAIKDREAAIEAKVALTPSAHAAEIRGVFLAMSPEDRTAAMATAFKDNDKEVLAALVNAPAITHGCNRDQLAAHYDAYKRDAAFGEYRVLDEHKKALRYLEAARPGIMKWSADIYSGTKVAAEKRATVQAVMKSYGFDFPDE